jgi:hypothetical protein
MNELSPSDDSPYPLLYPLASTASFLPHYNPTYLLGPFLSCIFSDTYHSTRNYWMTTDRGLPRFGLVGSCPSLSSAPLASGGKNRRSVPFCSSGISGELEFSDATCFFFFSFILYLCFGNLDKKR